MVTELPYSLHTRYASIAVAWTVILMPPIFINLGLFYGLWYGKPDMNRIAVLTIPTAVLGVFTIIGIVERIWKLIQPSPQFRPLKASRGTLDVFQWGYFVALILISGLITLTLARDDNDHDGHELQIRLISMPASVLMFLLATLTMLSLILNSFKVTLPFRFGSVNAGNVVRPAIYYIVEDVVAVDGNGGTEYREAFMTRYETSSVFQEMILTTSMVWMVAFYVFAIGFTVLVFCLPWQAAYAVGWAGPFPLAGIMVLWTIYYVKAKLKEEGAQGERTERSGTERTPLLA